MDINLKRAWLLVLKGLVLFFFVLERSLDLTSVETHLTSSQLVCLVPVSKSLQVHGEKTTLFKSGTLVQGSS